jgi:UDP-glucuronate 4-epimerase
MKILVTGATGFIGSNLVRKLALNNQNEILAIDSMNSSYGNTMNELRLKWILEYPNIVFKKLDLSQQFLKKELSQEKIDVIVHLAAWPGVRQSEINKSEYYRNNINAFGNILDLVTMFKPNKFFFASSSSIYGNKGNYGPVREEQADGLSLKSFYATTKWANEVLASSFSKNLEIPVIALRFFTVFGSFGRPDMAYWKFCNKLLNNEAIDLYGIDGGERNFTGINNLVSILEELITQVKFENRFQALNVAHGDPMKTDKFLSLIANSLGIKNYLTNKIDRPLTDVEKTWADLEKLNELVSQKPRITIEEEIQTFCDWFKTSKFARNVKV